MTSKSKNNNVLRASSSKPISAERAARFLDTQEEFLENLALRPERNKKEYEKKLE